jgi:RHS repeat-associated protein
MCIGRFAKAYKYKYQGQERQDELGLNWDSFKWRNYDYAIGRFMSIDPLTEEYDDWTPYAFAGNQVVHSRELEGLEPEKNLNKKSEIIYKKIETPAMQTGYPGQALEELVTAGIQWLGTQISGSDVSKETSENIQLATSVLVVISSKGKNTKADAEVVEQLTKVEARAAKLSEKARPGESFTKAGKEAVKDVNAAKNGGKTVCETCGTKTTPSTQSKKGVTPAKTETNVDHVVPKSKGGSGTPDNGQVLCRDCNIKKSNN